MANCSSCRAVIQEGVPFCSSCGAARATAKLTENAAIPVPVDSGAAIVSKDAGSLAINTFRLSVVVVALMGLVIFVFSQGNGLAWFCVGTGIIAGVLAADIVRVSRRWKRHNYAVQRISLAWLTAAVMITAGFFVAWIGVIEMKDGLAVRAVEKAPSNEIRTQGDFESSQFCLQFHCKEDSHWQLRTGSVAHDYKTNLTQVSVNIQTTDPRAVVTGLGLVFSERMRLSAEDLDAMRILTRSIDQSTKHDKTISFIEHNVEGEVCSTCSVPESTRFIIDGDFRVTAGNAGGQVVSFDRASTFRPAALLTILEVGNSFVRVGDLADNAVSTISNYEYLKPIDEFLPHQQDTSGVRRYYRINGKYYSALFGRKRGGSGADRVLEIRDEGAP